MASKRFTVVAALLRVSSSFIIPPHVDSKLNLPNLAAAAPISTPISDWQKDGKAAQWAAGYPKTWGSEEVKYTQASYSFALWARHGHSRRQVLVLINDTNTRITNLDTGATVADIVQTGEDTRLTASNKGGYDLLISTPRTQNSSWDIYHYNLSKEGVPVGGATKLYSETTSFDPDVFLGPRFTADQQNEAFIYDLDHPDKRVALTGHTDALMSASFSPDDKYSADNGSFISDFKSSTAQNWVTRFSSDSKYVAIANGVGAVKIYTVANLTAPAVIFDQFSSWVRTLQWSPDGKYISGGSTGKILVYSFPDGKVVQKWELDDENKLYWELVDVLWLDGRKILAYRVQGALEVYDFESNLKYKWGLGENDTFLRGFDVVGTFHLKTKGWIGGFDWDHSVRFWKYPAA